MGVSSNNHGIHVFGEGVVSAEPDVLKITLGVFTDGIELQSAQTQNGIMITKVITGVIEMGIIRDDIRTVDYRIDPQYRYEDGKQVFQGYRVTHLLEITSTKISEAGKIVDASVQNGANAVQSIQFSLKNSEAFYQHALSLAGKDAVQKAETLARTFGVSFYRIPYLILEEQVTNRPVPIPFSALKSEAQTPVLPGKLAVQARIKAYFPFQVNSFG
ncbi:SIMPL domain-containing protein [Bacillus sp. 1NLA3E]|uniref:SIMPL domain-containing protein n=1 Tax=Bacillus sp. 1NLA3E TaxID=666686 RepID=UPI000247E50D|nr:SIMPL domain-containing protein [Bacillus sp. 1NLA3E]